MGREALDATVITVATRAALAAVVVAAVLILPAVLAGILDHLGRARRLAHVLRRISPPIARRCAVIVVAVVASTAGTGRAFAAPPPAGDPSVRDWLERTGTTRVGAAAPSGTWYSDPGDPTGDSGPHGTIDLEDLDTRTTSTTAATTTTTRATPSTTSTTRVRIVRRPRRPAAPRIGRFIPPPYAPTGATGDAPVSTPAPIAPPTYTVVRGDCLWAIAAHRLPPTASAADVDRAWRAIYDANRAVIGSDPNLIRPGQILALPPLPTSA